MSTKKVAYSVQLSVPNGAVVVYDIKAKNPATACEFAYMRLLGEVGEQEAKKYSDCKIEKQPPMKKSWVVTDHYVFPKRDPLNWQEIWQTFAERVNKLLDGRREERRDYLYIHDVAIGRVADRYIECLLREANVISPYNPRPRDRYIEGDVTVHGIPYVPKARGAL